MRVGVEILTGRFFNVEVEEEATVEVLKKEIASKEETLHENRLILMLSNGRLMRDDRRTLAMYGVTEGSIIYLFFTSLGSSHYPSWFTYFEDFVTFYVREC
uniref:Ubiquitin-like domain-containing protein n=1 Tax=Ananas comosus var. bracteatus TaxID=296719 RepID=A0A6V7NLE0_ANACO|nr:unnamed protein product [Ananas comosus var. bracteatus]